MPSTRTRGNAGRALLPFAGSACRTDRSTDECGPTRSIVARDWPPRAEPHPVGSKARAGSRISSPAAAVRSVPLLRHGRVDRAGFPGRAGARSAVWQRARSTPPEAPRVRRSASPAGRRRRTRTTSSARRSLPSATVPVGNHRATSASINRPPSGNSLGGTANLAPKPKWRSWRNLPCQGSLTLKQLMLPLLDLQQRQQTFE